MVVSKNQELPRHLAKRNFRSTPVYDLTFDYDFLRVPRDLGKTQMRVDFSNEEGYWDSIVNKAGNSKKKRSLAEAGGNHKRWLEDEWRDDLHFGALSHEELHKRWFGSDVIDWLRGLIGPFKSTNGISHSINQEFTAVLLDEQFGPCPIGGASVQANLEAIFKAKAKVDTNFGLTIIAELAPRPDLSQSYLYFKNKGEITAKFTLDALASATFDTGPRELFGLENFPGATFRVPGILTVGPNFRLFASVDARLVLAGHLESQVNIASWDVQQTYPQQSQEFEPKDLDSPDRDGTQILSPPKFDYSVSARGEVTAHLMPTFTFGIDFEPRWSVDSCKVDLVADGWVRLMASAEVSSNPSTCPFTYGVDAGADLYTQVSIPKLFNWGSNRRFDIARIPPKQIVQGGSCPAAPAKRDLLDATAYNSSDRTLAPRSLRKRETVGPLLTIPSSFLKCPGGGDSGDQIKCAVCGPAAEATGDLRRRADDVEVCRLPPAQPDNQRCEGGSVAAKRDFVYTGLNVSGSWDALYETEQRLEKRARNGNKEFDWRGKRYLFSQYPACDASSPPSGPAKWYSFDGGQTGCSASFSKQNKNGDKVGNIPINNFASEYSPTSR
jgi:chitinase